MPRAKKHQSGELFPKQPKHAIVLDGDQLAAVRSTSHNTIVLAGAGSGKTRTIAGRIEHLIRQGVPPNQICLITFTKDAANELLARLRHYDILPKTSQEVPPGMMVGTIHSMGARICMRAFPGWKIADTPLRYKVIREALNAVNKRRRGVGGFVEFADAVMAVNTWKRIHGPIPKGDIGEICGMYQRLLEEKKLLDFDDLIYKAMIAVRSFPRIRAAFRSKWRHFVIDEAQDTDIWQWRLIHELWTEDAYIYAVGDLAQSIYGFRGAQPSFILGENGTSFSSMFGSYTVYSINNNYRSYDSILRFASSSVVEHREAVDLTAVRGDSHFSVRVLPPCDSMFRSETGNVLIEAIEEVMGFGYHHKDIAVLSRTNAFLGAVESTLAAHAIPYLTYGSDGFFDSNEVRDILAYLAIACAGYTPRTIPAVHLDQIYNRPVRYLGPQWLAELRALGGWQVFYAQRGDIGGLNVGTHGHRWYEGARRLWRELGILINMVNAGATPDAVIEAICKDLKYRNWLERTRVRTMDDVVVTESLDTLITIAREYKTVEEFVSFVMRSIPSMRSRIEMDAVRVSTVHKVKGLEFPVVIIVGIDGEKFPHKRGDQSEERRIFYVAATRARDLLYLSCIGETHRFIARGVRSIAEGRSVVEVSWEEELADAIPEEVSSGDSGTIGDDTCSNTHHDHSQGSRGPIEHRLGSRGADDAQRQNRGIVGCHVRGVLE